MKTIGLLGGTGWSSTITYYTKLNQLVNQRLGGYHSAKIILKSIDYHDIMSHYGKNHDAVAERLHSELLGLMALKPDCLLICCNSLHKYYDKIKEALDSEIPVFHAVELVATYLKNQAYEKVLLLATKVTMEDGFFAKTLERQGIQVVIPTGEEREAIHRIHDELMQNTITEESKNYFKDVIASRKDIEAVVLGCTEFPLIVTQENCPLPLIDPVVLQTECAIDYALEGV